MFKSKWLSRALLALLYFFASVCCCSAFGQSSRLQVPREWSDRSGKFSIEATIISANDEDVTLLKHQSDAADKRVSLSLKRLSDADQKYASSFARARLKELKLAESRSAVASECFTQFKEFVDQGFVDESNRLFVEARMEALEPHREANRVLLKETYLSPEQFVELRNESELKAREWLKLRAADSLGTLRDIIANDPSCLIAPLLLGIYYDISAGDAAAAERVLENAIEEGNRYSAVASEADRRNLHAAINNLAVATVRQGRVGKAVRLWNQIVDSRVSGVASVVNANINRVASMIERDFSGLRANGKAKRDLVALRSNEKLQGERFKSSNGWGVVLPVDQQLVEFGQLQFLNGSSKFHRVSSGAIFDTRCVQCQGTDILRCSREGCVKGKIERRIMDDVYAPNGHYLGKRVVRVEHNRCGTCGGDGNVACPCCNGGSQP